MSYLVDTNIISELCRRLPDENVLRWARSVNAVAISAVTVEEIYFGLAWHPNARVMTWMEAFLQRHEILPVSPGIASSGGRMRGRFAAQGIVREQADMLIAATAQAHQLTLVTRNTRDFEFCGIELLNPFSETR